MNNESNISMIIQGIRQGIATKKYLPGMKVKEADLCREFSVSRTPVREAFRLLQNEGILTYIPHRGVQVATFSEKSIFDCLELRSALEVLSARKAAAYASEAQIGEARAINEKILVYNPDDPSSTTDIDGEFHMCIARMSQNDYIVDTLGRILNSQSVVRVFLPFKERRVSHTYKEHCDILDAIEAHSPEVAQRYMEIHFYNSISSNRMKIDEMHAKEQQVKKTKSRRMQRDIGICDVPESEIEKK